MNTNKKPYIVPCFWTVSLSERNALLVGSTDATEFGGEGNGTPAASDRRKTDAIDNAFADRNKGLWE